MTPTVHTPASTTSAARRSDYVSFTQLDQYIRCFDAREKLTAYAQQE